MERSMGQISSIGSRAVSNVLQAEDPATFSAFQRIAELHIRIGHMEREIREHYPALLEVTQGLQAAIETAMATAFARIEALESQKTEQEARLGLWFGVFMGRLDELERSRDGMALQLGQLAGGGKDEAEKPRPHGDPAYQRIQSVMADFAREFNDQAGLKSTTTRAYHLHKKTEGSLDWFIDALYEARAITLERSGAIKSETPAVGAGFAKKRKTGYFFTVLENLLWPEGAES